MCLEACLGTSYFQKTNHQGLLNLEKKMHSGDLKATFQYLKEGFKKDGDRFFIRTCSDRIRDNGFKLKIIMSNKPRCCFYCFCCTLYPAFGSPGSSFSQMQSWDCLHFHLITFILIYLHTLCPTYCWAVFVWCALPVYQKMSTVLKHFVILAKLSMWKSPS